MAFKELYISQIPYKLPELAMSEARKLKEEYDQHRIGVEIIPFRFHSGLLLAGIAKETGVDVAVAGVTTARWKDYANDLNQFADNPNVTSEIRLNQLLVGAQKEPVFSRVFGTHLRLARRLHASYLAMHHEPTEHLMKKGAFDTWVTSGVLYARKNGWGPQDNRPHILSWNIYAIRNFVDRYNQLGGKVGALLATDTALRTGLTLPEKKLRYDLQKAFEELQPHVIQIADYHPNGKKEKLKPGDGLYKDALANLIQESSRSERKIIYTIEVANSTDVRPTIEFILENLRSS